MFEKAQHHEKLRRNVITDYITIIINPDWLVKMTRKLIDYNIV